MSNEQLSINGYSSYKDSGVEWLGEIPEHWKVRRMKEVIIGALNYGANETAIDSNPKHPRFIRITDFSENEQLKQETFKSLPPEIAQKYLLKEGDILFARSGATVGKTFHFKNYQGQACHAGYLIKARPNPKIITSDFLSYYTKSSFYNTWKSQVLIKATIENISAEKYSFFLFIPLPLLSEQKAIADYLDTKSAEIDRKIDLLTQKAQRYEELKTALINETVTRGLDKSVPMKDSGIEWIGQIPEHWQVVRINDIAIQQKIKNIDLKERNLLSLSYGKIKRKDFDTSFGLLPESFETYQIIERGNIILRLTDLQNDKRSLRVGFTPENGIITSAYLCLKILRKVYPHFAYYLLYSYDVAKVFYWFGGGLRQSMKFDDIKIFPFIIPPLSEQKEIADYLDAKSAEIEQIIQTIKTQIEKLKELRKTLINDVVTGKIRVTDINTD
ncbi:MAG: restriction endonuclease subunit S [Cyanobacteriota bacterium]|jgi:type I restriction enzyme S subunit